MTRRGTWIAALAVAWLGWAGSAEAQYCQGNVDCGAGWVCQQGTCVQGAGVQAGAQVGGVGVQGQVQVTTPQPVQQAQPVQPMPQQQQPAYYAPQPQAQPQVRYEERPIWGLIGPGIGLLAGGYVVNILISGIGSLFIAAGDAIDGDTATLADEFFYTSLIPAAGPWVQLAITQSAGYDGWAPWLIIDGLLQTAGLTMIILGAVLTQRVAVYADLGDGVELGFAPGIGGGSASLTF